LQGGVAVIKIVSLNQCCGSGIRCPFESWIRDEQPGSHFRELLG
jgi:hypothetical protein